MSSSQAGALPRVLPRQVVALLVLVGLIAGSFSAMSPARGQDDPSFDVQVRAQLHDSGRIEFGLRADGTILTPRFRFYTPGRSVWAVSSAVPYNNVLLQVIARTQADGDVEFGIRADGETVLRGQIFETGTAPNTWLVSRAASVSPPDDAGSLVIYSGRGESLVGALIEAFEDSTGIDVEVRYGSTSELALLIGEEGANSPADLFYGQDAGALSFLAESGLAATLPADILASVSNANFKDDDGQWVGTSGRARVLIVSTERVAEADRPNSVFDLTDEEWRGRVSWAPGNGSFQAFVTAMRVIHGEAETREWLEGMIANDVTCRRNNSTQINAVVAGTVDIGLVNHYYRFRDSFAENA
ncbi:MAG: extracellular solute-binding protein, partial [Chloroflexi bacterium]|nr:extracellular solute-binding protein [Chloroflexota bacterium]